MVKNSKIGWTHHTHNYWEGCAHKIDIDEKTGRLEEDPACVGCYAEILRDHRYKTVEWGPGKPRRLTSEENRKQPLRWDRAAAAIGVRERVFSLSLGDWLDPEVPIEWLAELLSLIEATPNLDWLLLTKRIELWEDRLHQVVNQTHDEADTFASRWLDGDAPENIWAGVTAGTQKTYDRRAPILSEIPAKIKFISMEPLLEEIDFRWWAKRGQPTPNNIGFDWVISGGHSGSGDILKPFHLEHAESAVKQARQSGVKVFLKQMGDLPVMQSDRWAQTDPLPEVNLRKQDATPEGCVPLAFTGKGEEPQEWPEHLRIREFPGQ